MKGLTPIIATIVLLLITVTMAFLSFYFIMESYSIYTSKTISTAYDFGYCSGRAATITVRNMGTDTIQAASPPDTDFSKLGNRVPNAGFEYDANANGMPDNWEGSTVQKKVDAVLITDLSDSMSDCMDSMAAKPDMDTVLMMQFSNDSGVGEYYGNQTADGVFTVFDYSGSVYNGTADGNGAGKLPPSFNSNGKVGGALEFDGVDDYIKVTNDSFLNLTGDMTIIFWAYPTDMYKGRQNPVYKSYGGEFGIIMETDGSLSFYQGSCGGECHPYCYYGWGGVFTNNQWVHIAVVRNMTDKTIKLYKNGEYAIQKSSSDWVDPSISPMPLQIGQGYTTNFAGMIDELAIYKRPLSQKEIISNFNMLKREGSDCPTDDKDDLPSGCRYETALCPQSSTSTIPEEMYVGLSFTPPSFKSRSYAKVSTPTSQPSANCYFDDGCDLGSCNADIYNGTVVYGPSGEYANDCPTGKCQGAVTSYSGCDWGLTEERPYQNGSYTYFSYCTSSPCDPDENIYSWCDQSTCNRYDRSQCGTDVCPSLSKLNGQQTLVTDRWIPDDGSHSCASSECATTTTRHTSYQCTEDTCGTGYTACSECGTCPTSSTCCCLDSSKQKLCRQEQDYCCDIIQCIKKTVSYGYCASRTLNCYDSARSGCCTPVTDDTCAAGDDTPLQTPCIPGFVNGPPSPANNDCLGSAGSPTWQCRAEGGSCYICNSVAIRLAKKLDKGFVGSVLSQSSGNTRIGLVSYGTDVGIPTAPTSSVPELTNAINGYSADKGQTCIACAIAEAENMLKDSAANKKYVVLMSDGDANIRDNYASTDQNGDGLVDARDDAIARACHAASAYGLIFFTVGFGKDAGASTLQAIARCSGANGRYFQSNDPSDLADIYSEISQVVSNAGVSDEKAFGEKSLLLNADQDVPTATSDPFDVSAAAGLQQNLSFYRKLNFNGLTFDVSVAFYDVNILNVGIAQKAYTNDMNDQALVNDYLLVNIPGDAAYATISFSFSQRGSGTALIDDVYLGPPLTCTREGGGYRCGELYITKLSNDADLYPYVDRSQVGKGGSITIKDANCQGECSYKINTISNSIDATSDCGA